jgi:hypothetical protein
MRITIRNGDFGPEFTEYEEEGGRGRDGQVKVGTCLGRNIEIVGTELNVGSLLDLLNPQVASSERLEKGWFFGYGGPDDEAITALFHTVFPEISLADQLYRRGTRQLQAENPAAAESFFLTSAELGHTNAETTLGINVF